MQIIHFSDTHLGFNDLDVLNNENINQREADFYNAFTQVVDAIIRDKPSYIIHTGDLFHRSSPSNRAITFALEQFKIIDKLGIPFILIAGNHSTPKTHLSSPILKIFEGFENIYLSYSQKYKKIEFEDIVFHTLPHMNDETRALHEIALCEENLDNTKKNIIMMHCSVGATYLMSEFGEWVYPKDKEYIFKKMDYVALGHWHGFGQVAQHKNTYYSGSTERTSLNDKRNSKGFISLNLQDQLQVQYKEISIRPIIAKEIDCLEYENSLHSLSNDDTKDAIVEVVLKNLNPLLSIDILNTQIIELFPEAMSVNVKREFLKTENENDEETIEALDLENYFLHHLKGDTNEKEYTALKEKTQALFAHYEEIVDDTY